MDVHRINVRGPDTHYSAVPEGVMKYASFMNEIGTVKTQVKNWKDVFFSDHL